MKQRLILLLLVGCLVLAGCGPDGNEPVDSGVVVKAQKPAPVSVLFVDTYGVANEIQRQWLARRDGEVTFAEMTLANFVKDDFAAISDYDTVVYPAGLIGELSSSEKIIVVPKNIWGSAEVNKKGLLRHSRLTAVSYGKKQLGLPLGMPQFCLIYRADVLTALKVEPPTTWSEFFTLAEKLRKLQSLVDAEGKALPRDVDIPLAQGWAGHSLLAVAASRARHRGKLATVFEMDTADPLINRQPFVDAMKEIKEVSTGEADSYTPAEIWARMLRGESAMAIGWPSSAFTPSGEFGPNENIQFSRVPGSTRWFDFELDQWRQRDAEQSIHVDLIGFSGRLVSVLRSTDDPNNAFDFASWLSSQPISLATMPGSNGSGPFRASHLGDIFRWTGQSLTQTTGNAYADLIAESNEASIYFMFPRIPGYVEYINALDQAVRDFLGNPSDAKTQLDRVSAQWQETTDRIGRSNQLRALRMNEGF